MQVSATWKSSGRQPKKRAGSREWGLARAVYAECFSKICWDLSILLRPKLSLQLLGRNTEELFNVGAKMAVVKIAKFFANVMKVGTFADHALCEQGAVITKKIFGLETHCRLNVTL